MNIIRTMQSHLRYLKDQMIQIRHRPTLFEYYAAIQLTKQHSRPFYVYQDLPLRSILDPSSNQYMQGSFGYSENHSKR